MAENRVRMARTSIGAVFLMWFGCAVLFVCGFFVWVFLAFIFSSVIGSTGVLSGA